MIRSYTMKWLFIPFCLFQGSFFFYTSGIKKGYLEDPTNYPLALATYTLQFMLFSLASYFIQNQVH